MRPSFAFPALPALAHSVGYRVAANSLGLPSGVPWLPRALAEPALGPRGNAAFPNRSPFSPCFLRARALPVCSRVLPLGLPGPQVSQGIPLSGTTTPRVTYDGF